MRPETVLRIAHWIHVLLPGVLLADALHNAFVVHSLWRKRQQVRALGAASSGCALWAYLCVKACITGEHRLHRLCCARRLLHACRPGAAAMPEPVFCSTDRRGPAEGQTHSAVAVSSLVARQWTAR